MFRHVFPKDSTSSNKTLDVCASCCQAKAHRLPFTSSNLTATEPLQVVHCDVWGPAPIVSNNGYRFYMNLTDAFYRYSWILFCSHKSEISSIFTAFKNKVEHLLSASIKTIQFDGGSEFKPIMRLFPIFSFYQNLIIGIKRL